MAGRTKDRVDRLRGKFDGLRVDAFLVTFGPHLRYLSGFSGSSAVGLVTRRGKYFFTDGRYASQIKKEVRGWKSAIITTTLYDALRASRVLKPGDRVGFDGNTLLFQDYTRLKKLFPGVKLLPKADAIDSLAAVKDEREIDTIRRAVAVTDRVFSELLPMIKPGLRELDIAAEISYLHRRYGAEADAFETIVASGARSALPHGRATAKKIAKGDLVTLDFGCVVDGYHSDMTRTVAVGRVPALARKIYNLVLDAQEAAIAAARSGMKTSDLDGVARSVIARGGYEKYFRHSLGHGLGLQIHEPPRISVQSRATLETGNVVTIEPGIYIPGFGGVRIEDDIVVSNGSAAVLNRSPKTLLIL